MKAALCTASLITILILLAGPFWSAEGSERTPDADLNRAAIEEESRRLDDALASRKQFEEVFRGMRNKLLNDEVTLEEAVRCIVTAAREHNPNFLQHLDQVWPGWPVRAQVIHTLRQHFDVAEERDHLSTRQRQHLACLRCQIASEVKQD